MTLHGNVASEERLSWIRQRLDADGRVRISDASVELDVSEMTIRRDLQELEAIGQARRVRGGAVAVGPVPLADRRRSHARSKAKVAAKLVSMVPTTGAIGIDASSTLLRLASTLGARRDLTVLTNGPETFAALQRQPGINALLTGGSLEPRTGSLVGPLACRGASQLLLARLFVSAAGVTTELGASEACLEEAEVKRTMAEAAEDVVLAVDASKLGTRAMAVGVDWDHISVLVTDLDRKDPRLDPYRDLVDVV
jgi:DeoR family fructose operon transcriptional repressor